MSFIFYDHDGAAMNHRGLDRSSRSERVRTRVMIPGIALVLIAYVNHSLDLLSTNVTNSILLVGGLLIVFSVRPVIMWRSEGGPLGIFLGVGFVAAFVGCFLLIRGWPF
jgi:hypothetical protein